MALFLASVAQPALADAQQGKQGPGAKRSALDLVMQVRVKRIYISRLPRSRLNHVVEASVLRVLRGKFAGRRFDFRIHSPARAGIKAGSVVFIGAHRVKSGYLVPETAIGPLRCDAGSKICHVPGCQHYRCSSCTVAYQSVSIATIAGYKPHGCASISTRADAGPPKLPWSKDRVCKRASDCALRPHFACDPCPPCRTSWRRPINIQALERLKKTESLKDCHRRCPRCRRRSLGTKAVCVKGQCRVRP